MLFCATALRRLLLARKRASARCAVFYNGFCTPKAAKVDAVSTRFAIPAARNSYWLLAAGFWLLVAGCWLLVAGCWLPWTGGWYNDHWLLVVGCGLVAGY